MLKYNSKNFYQQWNREREIKNYRRKHKMKLTMGQLLGVIENGLLLQFIQDNEAPRLTRWRNSDIWEQLIPKLDKFNERHNELLKEFGTEVPGSAQGQQSQWAFLKESGELNENGTPKMVPDPDKASAFQEAKKPLLDAPLEISGEPFTEDDFYPRKPDAPTLPLSASNLVLLKWYIVPSEADRVAITAGQTSNPLDDAMIESDETDVLEIAETNA